MSNCQVCGNDYLRCNCVSQQPYCEQCGDDHCLQEMDASCVVYHPLPSSNPSLLTCLGISNGTSVENILEEIDERLCQISQTNTPIVAEDTSTINTTTTFVGGSYVVKGDVKLSADVDNIISANSDGIFAENPYKVKIDENDTPDYLENQLVGGTDGIVAVSIVNNNVGILQVSPQINLANLVLGLCSNLSFENCILSKIPLITPVDTNSINLTVSGAYDHTIQADAIISPDVDNALEIRANGLYATGGTTTARNGLSINAGFVELGGTLIQNTIIDHAATYQLSFTNHPRISIGNNTFVGAATYVSVFNNDNAIINPFTVTSERTLDNINNPSAFNVVIKESGGPIIQTGDKYIFGSGGQLWINSDIGNFTLSNVSGSFYTGTYGAIIKSGANNITGNIISAGYFTGYGADEGSVSEMAAIRAGGLTDPPPIFGGNFTGTITNYYGLYIDDITNSSLGTTITNKFAIYQEGVSDISRFFGPVQNASNAVQFTSDARVKENIKSFTRGLTEIDQISTHTFNYTYNKDKTVAGIIAQEIESIIPEAVSKENFSTPQGEEFNDFRMVDQTVLFYTMLNAIKELSAKVKALENN